jgi:hypothetical protein
MPHAFFGYSAGSPLGAANAQRTIGDSKICFSNPPGRVNTACFSYPATNCFSAPPSRPGGA